MFRSDEYRVRKHFSNYNEGSFTLDDVKLAEEDIHRLGNVLVPMESYGPLIEKKLQAFQKNVSRFFT